LRILVPALLLFGAALAVAGSPANASTSALTGTWTWTLPNVTPPPDLGLGEVTVAHTTESGTLALGGGSGEWTVDLPSAFVGCAAGKPLYAPKLGQAALVQTYPDGTCKLYLYNNGHYVPYWTDGKDVGAATVGPFWGIGDFR